MTAVVVTLEELGIKPTIPNEDGSRLWFDHSQVVEAFRAHGLGPVVYVKDLFEKIFNTSFKGYVPDEKFFTEENPSCPCFEIDEFYKSHFLDTDGGWPPYYQWLLEKS